MRLDAVVSDVGDAAGVIRHLPEQRIAEMCTLAASVPGNILPVSISTSTASTQTGEITIVIDLSIGGKTLHISGIFRRITEEE